MTRIIFVRHAQSVGNSERRFYGHYDKGLSELGLRQAELVGEFLKDCKIDAAYSSDLSRAFITGENIVAHHKGLTLIPDRRLREIFAGDWENQLFDELLVKYPREYGIVWKTDIGRAHPVNGESVMEVADRIRKRVWEIAKENEGKTVLIATHATPIRTLACEWKGVDYTDMKDIPWVKNASTSIIDYDTENMTTHIVIYDESSYLGDIATSLPKTV
ncbi:MAG: histidine phosphatase family protein [Clostridia bacterium]|nr:histidine phosphatase family protein [Clostridia bacterium]